MKSIKYCYLKPYCMIQEILISFALGYVFTLVYEFAVVNTIKKRRGDYLIVKFKGYHIHHSMIGIALIVVWLFVLNPGIFAAGTGVIARHTHSEKKFTFIDRK